MEYPYTTHERFIIVNFQSDVRLLCCLWLMRASHPDPTRTPLGDFCSPAEWPHLYFQSQNHGYVARIGGPTARCTSHVSVGLASQVVQQIHNKSNHWSLSLNTFYLVVSLVVGGGYRPR